MIPGLPRKGGGFTWWLAATADAMSACTWCADEGEVSMVDAWLNTAGKLAEGLSNGKRLYHAYAALIRFIDADDWTGACHSSSAVLYILLSEMGFSPRLMIGEVRAPAGTFDHSWVEVEGNIFDAASGYPGEDGDDVGGSVFASVDLRTGGPTENDYGVSSPGGLDDIGRFVAGANLADYVTGMPPGPDLWDIAKHIGAACGLKLKVGDLRRKYGKVRRTVASLEAAG